ncbi:ADP-ribosylation factor-like protein 2 [Leptotrombidium deliense]|uniref:small monomeric GTPase n=1 Tax=Leptotrombidium deliense TaxID=299467 RepID=A0A443RY46_9ACAR|nr:ADP-ribosylation factor-like protein 2 [Leptotrombidium deliense]
MVLLSILKKLKQKEREVRLLVLGLDNAGKTTLVKKFNGDDIHTISPTLGFNIYDLEHKGYCKQNYFESTDGLIWVIDSADKSRFEDCRNELFQLIQEEQLAGASLLVFANKQDLDGSLKCDEIADFLHLSTIKTSHWKILPCSAYTGDNLLEGIDWILDDISHRIFTLQ